MLHDMTLRNSSIAALLRVRICVSALVRLIVSSHSASFKCKTFMSYLFAKITIFFKIPLFCGRFLDNFFLTGGLASQNRGNRLHRLRR